MTIVTISQTDVINPYVELTQENVEMTRSVVRFT